MDKLSKLMTFVVAVISILFFSSCEKENEVIPRPIITLTELGYKNTKTGYAGSDLHIDAEIIADGKIDVITIEIHPEGEHEENRISIVLHEGEWEVDTMYTKFSGLKNTTFHEHVDIPIDADTGHYHFHIKVTDLEGQQTSVEEEILIQYPDDDVSPEITVLTAPTSNQVFNNGETISISGSVSDDKALGGLYIGLVPEGQNLSDAEVNATNTITLLHTHDFDSPAMHEFTSSITVGAAKDNDISPKDITGNIAWQSADYYIVVKCKDAFGANWTYSNHYSIVINY